MANISRGGLTSSDWRLDPSRKAVYLDVNPSNPVALPPQLLEQWHIDRLSDPMHARTHLEVNHYPVGLARLDNLSSSQINQIQELVNETNHTNWIALLHRPSLDHPTVRQLIHDYFYDFHTLPLPPQENVSRLQSTLGHAYGIELLDTHLTREPHTETECQMIGASEEILQIFKLIRKIAHTDAPVLISGESGTGKELIAQALHQRSDRADGPFIPVNCGALPDTLIHSELFGHEKGAYTGAHKQNIGRLEAANNGTIFLDEIGDLPIELQTYLLRFLQEKTIERLGSTKTQTVNARVIAATHVNLNELVSQGKFREDLYFRLNVLNVKVPPLRERNEDIILLAQYFFQQLKQESNSTAKGYAKSALTSMTHYLWPGNVRELINRVRRALVMSEHKLITADDLGLEEIAPSSLITTLEEARNLAEKEMLKKGLMASDNNISKAARSLGVSRVTLYHLLDKHHMR